MIDDANIPVTGTLFLEILANECGACLFFANTYNVRDVEKIAEFAADKADVTFRHVNSEIS